MRILLVETSAYAPASPLFSEALAKLDKAGEVSGRFFDEAAFFPARAGLFHRAWARLARSEFSSARTFNDALCVASHCFRPDLVLVVKGAAITPDTLREVKRITDATLVNYATDDPFNTRASSPEMVACIPYYDVYFCTKRAIMPDVAAAGGARVEYLPFAYKPEVHFPEPPDPEERERFVSEVAFIGGADPERAKFFERVLHIDGSLRLALYGGYWNRYPRLRRYHRGFASGREFRFVVSTAAVTANLVRWANRDGHVMRSYEIPACGGVPLMEDTDEHRELFGDAVWYFNDEESFVEGVQRLLADRCLAMTLADRARKKITDGANTYADRLASVIDLVTRA